MLRFQRYDLYIKQRLFLVNLKTTIKAFFSQLISRAYQYPSALMIFWNSKLAKKVEQF